MTAALAIVSAFAMLVAGLGFAAPAAGSSSIRVAIIVGPVGEELTPVYLRLAETAAAAAETRGASVARAYSPAADAGAVLAAVEGANIVIYFGHGVGSPNPYSPNPSAATTNGWGLNGPNAVGTHADSWADGTLAYYGEAWIAAHARPAPGWVMIYSNACYAPGASEGFDVPADQAVAATRVAAYSRAPLAELGASAYFATDFYEGAARLIGTLLDRPHLPYGDVFASEPHFHPGGLARLKHGLLEGAETWLHRSAYFEGRQDYWYAFAGDPTETLAGGIGLLDATLADATPGDATLTIAGGPLHLRSDAADGVVTGIASHYGETPGWEGIATVALPLEMGGDISETEPTTVVVCGNRCTRLPVVDSCPCYVGTLDARVANLSTAAWSSVTDAPLDQGLVEVTVHLGTRPPGAASPIAEP